MIVGFSLMRYKLKQIFRKQKIKNERQLTNNLKKKTEEQNRDNIKNKLFFLNRETYFYETRSVTQIMPTIVLENL